MSWNHTQTRQQRGYGVEWQHKRLFILERDNGLCQICKKKGKYTPATEVDHIKPKAQGGTDSDDNLQSLCTSCHKEKTTRDNGGEPRLKSPIDITGEPTNQEHPWNT